MNEHWLYLPVNPEPWAIGSISVGKRNGKMIPIVAPNIQLKVYQDSIKEELNNQLAKPYYISLYPGKYSLTFYFWRRLDKWETAIRGKKVSSAVADATNLQKATEDALQGILFDNDRDVCDIRSVIVDQRHDIEGGVAIRISNRNGLSPEDDLILMSKDIYNLRTQQSCVVETDNSWPPKD